MEVKRDIEEALKLIKGEAINNYAFDTYCSAFLFGTENQEAIHQIMEYKGKDVATVASSGDQYLASVYYEANKVDLYDINYLTYYITYLKIASVLTLDYEEFMRFMVPIHDGILVENSFWDLSVLKKIVYVLPSDVAYFWENVMYVSKKYNGGDFVVPDHYHAYKENIVRGMPFYAEESEYYKLQSLLRKREYPIFKQGDILSFSSIFKDTYDIVYLSNIIECLVSIDMQNAYYGGRSFLSENYIEEYYVKKVLSQVQPILRKEGSILVSYRPNTIKENAPDFLYTNDYFDVSEVMCKFPQANMYSTDLVLTYKPTKERDILKVLQ